MGVGDICEVFGDTWNVADTASGGDSREAGSEYDTSMVGRPDIDEFNMSA